MNYNSLLEMHFIKTINFSLYFYIFLYIYYIRYIFLLHSLSVNSNYRNETNITNGTYFYIIKKK